MPKKEKKNVNNAKLAFVISPIGATGSPIRKRANQILKHIIEPVVSKSGYETIRADKISKPGIITSQIIEHIINDSLVIADLTGHNPNVFYELAIRHTLRKPVIQIIEEGEVIPFDVSATRTIYINHKDLDSVDRAKRELEQQVKAVEKDQSLVDSPISMAVDLQSFKQSRDPESKAIAELRSYMQDISHMTREIYRRSVESQRATELERLERVIVQHGLTRAFFSSERAAMVYMHDRDLISDQIIRQADGTLLIKAKSRLKHPKPTRIRKDRVRAKKR